MPTIYKYQVKPPEVVGEATVMEIHKDALILTAGEQDGDIFIWARVNKNSPKVRRKILVVGTSWECDAIPSEIQRFIGTVSLRYVSLVLHIFDLGEA